MTRPAAVRGDVTHPSPWGRNLRPFACAPKSRPVPCSSCGCDLPGASPCRPHGSCHSSFRSQLKREVPPRSESTWEDSAELTAPAPSEPHAGSSWTLLSPGNAQRAQCLALPAVTTQTGGQGHVGMTSHLALAGIQCIIYEFKK